MERSNNWQMRFYDHPMDKSNFGVIPLRGKCLNIREESPTVTKRAQKQPITNKPAQKQPIANEPAQKQPMNK